MFIDPTGMSANPLYGSDGTYKGNTKEGVGGNVIVFDGKGDVSTMTNSQVKSKGGKELAVNNTQFNSIANTVKTESSGNTRESYAIASTIENEGDRRGNTMYDEATSGRYFGWEDSGKDTSYNGNAEASVAATINALQGGFDWSFGATKFDGIDFLAWGLNSPNGTPHNKFEEYSYIEITSSIYNNYKNSIVNSKGNSIGYYGKKYGIPASVFGNSDNWKLPSGSVPWSGFQYKTGASGGKTLDATASYGHTIFWRVLK